MLRRLWLSGVYRLDRLCDRYGEWVGMAVIGTLVFVAATLIMLVLAAVIKGLAILGVPEALSAGVMALLLIYWSWR